MTTMTRMARGAAVLFAPVALAAGVFVSEARAAGKCTNSTCAEEIAAACAGLSGKDLNACKKSVVSNCMTNPDCSCTDPSLPACGTNTTTSSTTTSTTSTTTTTTSSTTTITGSTTTTTITGSTTTTTTTSTTTTSTTTTT